MDASDAAGGGGGKPGPKPETLKIEGIDWEEAMKRALQVKRPSEGWPEEVKKPRKPGKKG